MKNLLALIGLAVVVFLVGGNYYGWYTFSSRTSLDGRSQYQFDIDTKKLSADAKAVGDRVGGAVAPDPAPPLQPMSPNFMGPPAPLVPNFNGPPAPLVPGYASQPGPTAGFTREGGFEIRLPPRR